MKDNQYRSAGKVVPPRILSMHEDAMAITMRDLFLTENYMDQDDEEDEGEIRASFLFSFDDKEDMELFTNKQGICVSCMFNPDL